MIELWSEDEARLGLKPITRKIWWQKGSRPLAYQRRRDQWLQLFAFVRPTDGDSSFLLSPSVNTAAMDIALKQFAAYANPTNDKVIVLLVDRAGWHTTEELTVPDGIRLFPLPPYTPELQPTECVWPPVREPLANRPIETMDELEKLIIKRCQYYQDNPAQLQKHIGHHWVVEAERMVRRD